MSKLIFILASTMLLGVGAESADAQNILQRDVFTQREMATQFGVFSAPWGNSLDYEGRAAYVAQQRGTTAPPNVEAPSGDVVVHTGR
jgi:hypothetical protein